MLLGILTTTAVMWLLWLGLAIRAVRTAPMLAELDVPEPARWPSLSVIVPARDEAASLRSTIEGLLAQGYPDLEIVIVDDRSTDGTGAIADELAASGQVTAVHLKDLPDGWLGKVHALQRGVEGSRGELLLFLDADIKLSAGALRKAIAYAEQRGLDHLSLLPEMWPTAFLVDAAHGTLMRGFLPMLASARAAEDPRSGMSLGVGAFNLVRRRALERSPGLAHLRLEVADDVALAQMLKLSGARSSFALGMGTLGLHYYPTFGDLLRGTEKAPGALGGGSLFRLALMVATIALFEVGPFVGLAAEGNARIVAGIASALAVAASLVTARRLRRPLLATALVPLGGLVSVALLTRAGWLAARRGGLRWRDTTYPLGALRAGSRYRLFPPKPP